MTTRVVNTHEAKSRLSELIREAEAGVEVIVARNGHPVAKIIPWRPDRPVRVAGTWAGRIGYRGDVVGSDAEIVAMFDESAEADVP
ncbi:MAG: type II toxin-antitoxin system prevent-host-death family antitoxin [Acidimicrobiia bacterium]|nr:type II toxin-antitoxin system prevent-host-death family antitoxin [Acidimicrobiia bacterium]MCY4435184.1 type II toxin-antitoxin system prevent-host-death family antitoxin [bacterium]